MRLLCPAPPPSAGKGGPPTGTPCRGLYRQAPQPVHPLFADSPPPPAHGPLSPGSRGLCLPPPLLQPTPASGMTPGLPTPRWGHPENQKPPWESCRAVCGLSLCQTRAQPPRGSLHVPGWQMLCLLACRGGCWPALPGGEQLTWVAGAGRQVSRLPQGMSVTREGQPQPAGTRATPGQGWGRPKHGGLGSALTETLLPAPQGGNPCSLRARAPSSRLCPALWLQWLLPPPWKRRAARPSLHGQHAAPGVKSQKEGSPYMHMTSHHIRASNCRQLKGRGIFGAPGVSQVLSPVFH